MTTRRAGLAALATSLVIGGSVATAGTAHAEADFDFDRISGENRYETSADAAKAFGAANTVVLASGERGRYPDALTANYLAGLRDAPVLLTKQDQTPDETKAAITDSGARNIIIVGGESVISAAQEEELSKSYNVNRLAGDNRFGTAAAIIAEGGDAGTDTALLATGMNFPDALGGGPVAFGQQMPLAITRVDDMPDNVINELKRAGISKVLVLGGPTAVSKAVVDELEDNGITVEQRFNGGDRAETSTMLARHAIDNDWAGSDAVNVASGYNKGDGADALGGAPLTGKQGRALLITKSEDNAGTALLTFLDDFADSLTGGLIFGGPSALAEEVELEMEKRVLGSGAQIGSELYDDVAEAIEAAQTGDTITVFGKENAGFTVDKEGLTIRGENGAAVTEGIQVNGVDAVTIQGLEITPTAIANQVAGIYLDNAEDVTIVGNTIVGTGIAENRLGAGVINVTGGADETATLRNNTFRSLLQGVYANPSAEFVIEDNVFRNNTAASANDATSQVTGNRFIGNDEGIGLNAQGITVTGNSFGDHEVYVRDYTADEANYDLVGMIGDNEFDNEVTVTEDGKAIVDEGEETTTPASESPAADSQ